MKKKIMITRLLLAAALCTCGTAPTPSAGSSEAGVKLTPPAALYENDGGKDIRLTVGLPAGKGLASGDGWLTEFVQGNLIGDFQKYSAMTVIDRQNLDRIIEEQKLSETGFYEEKNYAQVGQLTNAQYILAGSITKLPGGDFSLQLGIADVEKGTRRASFTKTCTEDELKKTTVLKTASFELLTQMGVTLTTEGKQALYGIKSGAVEAETALARGIAAQKSGTVVEALSYYYNAASFDPSLAEAAGRLNVLSGTVAGGSIGQKARGAIQQREAWLKVMEEAAAFFKDHKPYEIVYDPTLTEGKVNYQSKTLQLSFDVALWPTAAFEVLNNILAGLEKTGKKKEWGFERWPLWGEGAVFDANDLAPLYRRGDGTIDALRGRMAKRGSYSYIQGFILEAALLNDKGETIALGLGTNVLGSGIEEADSRIRVSDDKVTITFSAKADDITDALTVKITKINGRDAAAAGRAGYVQITAAGTEYKIGDRGPAGGIIFFTMGGSGWRYLEAAPEDLPEAEWGAYEENIAGTEKRPGSGKKNTEFIVAGLKELGESGNAAQMCAEYELNGYRDWFLPSEDELTLMYENLKQNGLGNFEDEWYWSSTQSSVHRALCRNFGGAGWSWRHDDKDYDFCVRAARTF
jgi:hypothetical protein